MEQLYYKLSEAEQTLRVSRDTLLRLHGARLIVLHGENHGRCVTGVSLRALAARIEQGEDIWAVLKAIEAARESPAPSAPKRTARGRSTRTNEASGGTSPAKGWTPTLSHPRRFRASRPPGSKRSPSQARAGRRRVRYSAYEGVVRVLVT
jgi:hypothetical protein